MTAALSISGLTYKFDDRTAVDNIDLTVGEGEIFGLLGPNGAGKTTTIRSIVTILPVRSGSITVFDTDVSKQAVHARRLLGYVPQALSADSSLTGRENVSLFARLFDVPRKERKARVNEVLDAMGLSDTADRMAGSYSGGMVRRLELAQALVNQPRLLVLDEPTVGLDPIARESVWEHVQRLRDDHGVTVLLTTHYMEEADSLCDHVALMHRGSIRATDSPTALKAQLGEKATMDDVFRHFAGEEFAEGGDIASVRNTRRTANRLG